MNIVKRITELLFPSMKDMDRLRRLFERQTTGVSTRISPKDNMFRNNNREVYFNAGESVLKNMRLAMLTAGKDRTDIKTILDLPCGYGRILRSLRAAFPEARITACDLVREGVDFCAEAFDAIPVYSEKQVNQIPIKDRFDMIVCISLLTHVASNYWLDFLRLFDSLLNPGGLLIFTTHGAEVVRLMMEGRSYGLEKERLSRLLENYSRMGFGYEDYSFMEDYGISVASPYWVLSYLEKLQDLRLLTYTEKGFNDHQDIIACMKAANRRLKKVEANQPLLPAKAIPSPTTELFNKISEIPGWFTFDDCTHFSLCFGLQRAMGITGDMMEIGTYHGRSTAMVASGLNRGERLLVCDLFEDGPPLYGNRPTAETVMANILRVNPGLSPEAIKTVKGESAKLHLGPDERFRFIHVDGGHTYAECLSDLRFSAEHLIPNGLMVVDDYMHPDWPEVSRAIDDFLQERKDLQIISDLNRIGDVGRKVYLIRRY